VTDCLALLELTGRPLQVLVVFKRTVISPIQQIDDQDDTIRFLPRPPYLDNAKCNWLNAAEIQISQKVAQVNSAATLPALCERVQAFAFGQHTASKLQT